MKVLLKGMNACGMRKTNLDKYRNFLVANGHKLVNSVDDCDCILLWSCGFRSDYRDNSISEIARYDRKFPGKLVVAGCLPDIDMELLAKHFSGKVANWHDEEKKMAEIFGRGAKLSSASFSLGEPRLCLDAQKFKKEHPDKDVYFIDQFIKLFVAQGCRFECSYCSERLAFPAYHSFPEDQLVSECKRLIGQAEKPEVILLGDSVGDYGSDTATSLPELMRKLKGLNSGMKIALQGLNPAHFIKYFGQMKEFLINGDIRHLQLPIQSASERILQLMRRPYTCADIEKIFSLLNELKFTEIDTHLIIGFPGEEEEDFSKTIDFILRHRPKYVLVSGFMDSGKMEASGLPGKVDDETKRRRLRKAYEAITAAGIICNTDDSLLSKERFRRLNIIQGNEEESGKKVLERKNK